MASLPPIGVDKEQALLGSFLSNGRFVSLITPAGTGFATCGDVGLTRWSGDFTEDSEGWFMYVRDLESAEYWSVSPQPAGTGRGQYTAVSSPGCFAIDSEVADDVELRRLTLTNRSGRRRRLDVSRNSPGRQRMSMNTAAAPSTGR
jgi:cellobiose phosphorylase